MKKPMMPLLAFLSLNLLTSFKTFEHHSITRSLAGVEEVEPKKEEVIEVEEQDYSKLKKEHDQYVCESENKLSELNSKIEQLISQQQAFLSLFTLMSQLMMSMNSPQMNTLTFPTYQSPGFIQPYAYPLGENVQAPNLLPSIQDASTMVNFPMQAPQEMPATQNYMQAPQYVFNPEYNLQQGSEFRFDNSMRANFGNFQGVAF